MVILAFLAASTTFSQKDSLEIWKDQIRKTEQEFAAMVKDQGIKPAFLKYATQEAVLMRNNTLIIGKSEIQKHFEKQPPLDGNLSWTPEFIDVSKSGDLGYTYGYYTLSIKDSTDRTTSQRGVFHTIWKRQPNGSWRFVWD